MKPIIEFIQKLKNLGNIDSDFMRIILKAVGIGMITEITVMICSDSGNASLGKSLQILSSAVILWISLPVLNQLIDLLDQILGAI
jgi:stage III sporulation protein AD